MKCNALIAAASAAVTMTLVSASSFAGAFVSGSDLAVVRVGDGTTATNLTKTNALFIDEYDVSGATPVWKNTVAIPSTGITAATSPGGTGYRDGTLSRSPDGQYLTYAAYRANAGSADPSGTSTTGVIVKVGQNGVADTSLGVPVTSAFRSAVTANGSTFYYVADGANSTKMVNAATPGTQFIFDTGNYRSLYIGADQQLYASTGSTTKGVYKIGSGLPDGTTQTSSWSSSGPTSSLMIADSVASVVMLDLNSSIAGPDTVYGVGSSGLIKYQKNANGTWTSDGSIATPAGVGFGVAASANGDGSASLFFSTTLGIYRINDGGYGATLPGTMGSIYIAPGAGVAAYGGATSQYRGVSFAAVPEPAIGGILGIGSAIGLLYRRRTQAR